MGRLPLLWRLPPAKRAGRRVKPLRDAERDWPSPKDCSAGAAVCATMAVRVADSMD